MKFDARLKLFLSLAALWITALIVGDIIGGKLFEVVVLGRNFPMTVGMIPFPIVFLLTDLLNEFYGKHAARLVTFVGFFMALFAIAIIAIAVQIPWAAFTQTPDWRGVNALSFTNVFAQSQRILFASVTAYLVATLIDITVFHFIKQKTENRFLWLRATGSTLVSQCIDTVVVQFLAFVGIMPLTTILNLIATSYVTKVAIAIGLTPLIYAGHAFVEKRLHLNPVRLDLHGHLITDVAET